ncbi:MAG: hypothetical protein R3F14_37635 [Polyangiaceae bacterium]
MAVAKGDVGRARELLGEIEAGLTKVGARFDDGTELLGVRFEDGVRPQLTLVLRAAGAMAKGVGLRVRSKVTGRPAVWLSMVDPQEREVGMPMSIPPSLWREGFVF